MKQNISIKQLNELSEKGKKKLHAFLSDKGVNHFDKLKIFTITPKVKGMSHSVYPLPLLSIGQMIEFLKERGPIVIQSASFPISGWLVASALEMPKELTERVLQRVCKTRVEKTLVKVLWETVKEVLEK